MLNGKRLLFVLCHSFLALLAWSLELGSLQSPRGSGDPGRQQPQLRRCHTLHPMPCAGRAFSLCCIWSTTLSPSGSAFRFIWCYLLALCQLVTL